MAFHRTGVSALLPSPWAHRDLIHVLTRRELAGRYRGSVLGHAWAFVTPVAMLAVYTLVFGVILPSRWPGAEEGGLALFALRLLAGLLLHGLLAEALGRAPALVTSQPNYVTKVVFPLEVLGWVNVLTAAFHMAVGMVVLLVANAVWGAGAHPAQVALVLILIPFAATVVGLGWCFAALGVYVRDLGQAVGPLLTVAMFLGPVFYPREALPESMRGWLLLNPVTVPVEQARRVLFEHQWPEWGVLAAYTMAAVLAYCAGLVLFSKLKRGFADVL
jgi:lipopolysaccharide transport system permease protein